MFLVKFFKKHQKKILFLLFILVVFLVDRRFKILEGLETKTGEKKGGALADASAVKSLDDLKKMVAAQIEMAK